MTDAQRMIIRRTFRRSTDAAEPGWHADDPDDEDNMTFTPLVAEQTPPKQHDPQSRLDDFADRLTDDFARPSKRLVDIDRYLAERQGLRPGQGTLDPYADPERVVAAENDRLKPFRDRYGWLLNIAAMWGLTTNGYKLPKDKPDEDIQDYLDRMKTDLDERIRHKKRYGW